ncbi:MAG: 1-acyl-sn-glycerol-3-phosphate acyltransferase [Clostridia bacterium]|nr:1-acyl-sn-glycerol-3-phosphate acyltransferase [Clostridia bacterium]
MVLTVLFWLASVGSTVAVYALAGALSFWWILPIQLGFFVAWILLYLLGLLAASAFLSVKKPVEQPKKLCRFFVVITMDCLTRLLRCRITLHGAEQLPTGSCVLVSNHRSAMDPIATLAALKHRPLAFISKESNMKIPIVGPFIHHAGFHAIDRNNGMRALRTLKHAAEVMQRTGMDMGIYPEGTRSRTGRLLEFKTGAFLLAKRANAPIVVMSTKGTEKVFRRFPWRSTRIELTVLEVLPPEAVKERSMEELCNHVRSVIAKDLGEE